MQDDEFDSWLRTAAPTYNTPPLPDVDGMWANIEPQLSSGAVAERPKAPWWASQWLRAAALVTIGVGLGRVSLSGTTAPSAATAPVANAVTGVATADEASRLSSLSGPATDEYLGQTVALLASLQNDATNARRDGLAARASALLSTTRFLLDAPAGDDPRVRALLEDLELVLVQIVQMPATRSATDVDHIHQAMTERDVMPRLRTAVANINSAD